MLVRAVLVRRILVRAVLVRRILVRGGVLTVLVLVGRAVRGHRSPFVMAVPQEQRPGSAGCSHATGPDPAESFQGVVMVAYRRQWRPQPHPGTIHEVDRPPSPRARPHSGRFWARPRRRRRQ